MAGKATNRAYAQEVQMKNDIYLNPPDQWAVVIWCKSRKHARETKSNVDNGLRALQILRLPKHSAPRAPAKHQDSPELLKLIDRVRKVSVNENTRR